MRRLGPSGDLDWARWPGPNGLCDADSPQASPFRSRFLISSGRSERLSSRSTPERPRTARRKQQTVKLHQTARRCNLSRRRAPLIAFAGGGGGEGRSAVSREAALVYNERIVLRMRWYAWWRKACPDSPAKRPAISGGSWQRSSCWSLWCFSCWSSPGRPISSADEEVRGDEGQ
jgi:hypothetical protein